MPGAVAAACALRRSVCAEGACARVPITFFFCVRTAPQRGRPGALGSTGRRWVAREGGAGRHARAALGAGASGARALRAWLFGAILRVSFIVSDHPRVARTPACLGRKMFACDPCSRHPLLRPGLHPRRRAARCGCSVRRGTRSESLLVCTRSTRSNCTRRIASSLLCTRSTLHASPVRE